MPVHPGAYLKSPVGLAKALTVLFGVVIAADLLSLWAGTGVYSAAGDLAAAESVDELLGAADSADLLYGLTGLAQFGARIAVTVVFLVWFYRVRVNAEVFEPGTQSKGRTWAMWSWFVPFANLVVPRRAASDIWGASEPTDRRSSQGLLNSWWVFFVLTMFFERYASRAYSKAETLDEIRSSVKLLMASDVLDIAAAVLAVLFVRRLTALQTEKALRGPAA
ncbi:DUF4328 domain-containing protein [Streptomyces indicus]|uniref:DUF4328 domain-containing protein n=1 Tax=Streptomyces indicus TaxID=417292 RepID=UPI001FECD978|nr:DUF4328 domain-containing protein [Streptomyces indicus]